MKKKPKPYSLEGERRRLKNLKFRSCAWNRKGRQCQSCLAKQEWYEVVASMDDCSLWVSYRDCQMDNEEAIAFLEHVKTCYWCKVRRYRLMRRREIWFRVHYWNLRPLVPGLEGK